MAQLKSLGQDHGLQAFLVQIRDEETHKPLPGITIGEIGNKVGFNTVNNGFLAFNKVRIPMKQMLMKNAKVLETGEFVKERSELLSYGTMTRVRVGIVRDQVGFLAMATTIAMRYSLIRRQSPIDPKLPEPKIIDHVTQQMKIFPAIAKAVVFKVSAEKLMEIFDQFNEELKSGDLSKLPELHALSCCLKAVCTNEVTEAVQVCRLACGGHGYLESSGLNSLYKNATSAQTYEGENTVMLLQTARLLMKSRSHALKGKPLTSSVEYLREFVNSDSKSRWLGETPGGILKALQAAAAGKIALAFRRVAERSQSNPVEVAANLTGIELTRSAELHCQVFLLQSAIEAIEKLNRKLSPASSSVFKDILELYSVDVALRTMGSLLQVSWRDFTRKVCY